MINVVYLVSRLKCSGPINQAYNIITGINREECNMMVVTMSSELSQTRMKMYLNAGIKVVCLNRHDSDILGCVRDLRKIIKEKSIDIVHSSGDRPDICNHFLRRKVRTVSTLRAELSSIAERKGRITKAIMRDIHKYNIRTVGCPVACSDYLADSIYRSTGRRIKTIHNCVDTDLFCPPVDKLSSKRNLHLSTEKPVFLVLGRAAIEPYEMVAV